mmetsp:Transcript_61297/g.133174  ORF Transcript_61297/g.133174 Transcript_61297/m.133174 type:complete len:393 (-) Transcript_61297:33-1211(-)
MLRFLVSVATVVVFANALSNGLGRRPQMGYNSWYDLMCSDSMNETVILESAQALVSTGLAKLGYNYVNLDDCWAEGRFPNGTVYPDSKRFPSGMKALADRVHKLGLKFGLYSDRGNLTCGGRPGARGFEVIDARTYADWGVDYLKEDSCHDVDEPAVAFAEYGKMRDALNATGRPIFFSLCGWHDWYAPEGQSLGNSWRIGPDDTNWPGILTNVNIDADLQKYAAPGGWNDPCLLLGNNYAGAPAVTPVQARTQFNLWAVLASPLLISSNVRNLTKYELETYSNAEVIAVNQDEAGIQGMRVAGGNLTASTASTNVWVRQLSNKAWALLLVNVGPETATVKCDSACFAKMGFKDDVQARNLWTHEDIGPLGVNLEVALGPDESAMFKITEWF